LLHNKIFTKLTLIIIILQNISFIYCTQVAAVRKIKWSSVLKVY